MDVNKHRVDLGDFTDCGWKQKFFVSPPSRYDSKNMKLYSFKLEGPLKIIAVLTYLVSGESETTFIILFLKRNAKKEF
jgi:hypothetical protein